MILLTCKLPFMGKLILMVAIGSTLLICIYYSLYVPSEESSVYNILNKVFETKNMKTENEIQMGRMMSSIRQQRNLIETLFCKLTGIGARGGFCLSSTSIQVGGNTWWDFSLSKYLEENLFKNQTVGDFGAGLGWYGRFWMRKKEYVFNNHHLEEDYWYFNRSNVMQQVNLPMKIKSWEGFDGAGNVEEMTNALVSYLDLTDEQDLPVKYDWIFSIEVGEHIPHIFEDVFINNMIRHACKGIVISWAVVGQAGHYHVNTHNNGYVKQLFTNKGFRNNLKAERELRAIAELKYLVNTLMVFERESPSKHSKCLTSNAISLQKNKQKDTRLISTEKKSTFLK